MGSPGDEEEDGEIRISIWAELNGHAKERREEEEEMDFLLWFVSEAVMRKNTFVSSYKLKRIVGPTTLKLQGISYLWAPDAIDEEEKIDHRKIYFFEKYFLRMI